MNKMIYEVVYVIELKWTTEKIINLDKHANGNKIYLFHILVNTLKANLKRLVNSIRRKI